VMGLLAAAQYKNCKNFKRRLHVSTNTVWQYWTTV